MGEAGWVKEVEVTQGYWASGELGARRDWGNGVCRMACLCSRNILFTVFVDSTGTWWVWFATGIWALGDRGKGSKWEGQV